MIFASVQCWFRMSNPIIYICVIQQCYDRLKFDESYNKYELAFYTLKLVRFTFVNTWIKEILGVGYLVRGTQERFPHLDLGGWIFPSRCDLFHFIPTLNHSSIEIPAARKYRRPSLPYKRTWLAPLEDLKSMHRQIHRPRSCMIIASDARISESTKMLLRLGNDRDLRHDLLVLRHDVICAGRVWEVWSRYRSIRFSFLQQFMN